MNRKSIRRLFGTRLMRLIDALRHELRYRPAAELGNFRNARDRARKMAALNDWFQSLTDNPPDVLIGANVNPREGIRNHLLGIRNNSRLHVELSPPDHLLNVISYHDLHTTFASEISRFEPRGIPAIHSHVYPYFVKWCARHRSQDTRWVHTYHAPYISLEKTGGLAEWQHEINEVLVHVARHADVRISVSRWQQQYLESNHGISTIYVPNGVDVPLCDMANGERFRSAHGLDRFVLFVGRDDPIKNTDEFVRLAAAMPREQFLMIGSGLDESYAAAKPDRKLPNLTMLGELARPQVLDAIAACGALVVTSLREGLPTVILEAMACARPIVAGNEPGSAEALGNGEFGSLYEIGNLDDLKSKIVAALNGPDSIPQARSRILAEYDWRVVAAKLDAVYQSGAT